MKKTEAHLKEIKLIGIQVRTNNANEINWMAGKIVPCVQKYYQQQLADKIPNRKKMGTTYCAYTDYESDYRGDYTYFIGEEVSSIEDIPSGFSFLIISPQEYAKFTTDPGPMPGVLGNAWQKIWQMSSRDFGGPRAYKTDFEVYDERAIDKQNTVLDIFIGIQSKL